MTTSESKMKELYELINSTHSLMLELIHDDFDISPPNEDEDDWYICLEQKIIRWDEDRYTITCLYNSHKTLFFKTADEVVSFYFGYCDLWASPEKEDDSVIAKANNVGIYIDSMVRIKLCEKDYTEAINPKQRVYKSL